MEFFFECNGVFRLSSFFDARAIQRRDCDIPRRKRGQIDAGPLNVHFSLNSSLTVRVY